MINVFGSLVGKEELKEIKDCINRQWLGIGKKTEQFEKLMSEKVDSNFTAVDSGSNALYMAVKALNLKPDSEVILPSITWVACATSIQLAGLKVIFCDVDYETLNVTNKTISKQITKDTSAVMIVHYGGHPCEIITEEFPIIADCAHAVDSYVNGIHVSKFADISIFSFDSIKNISAGELGGICSDSDEYSRFFKENRYCGLVKSGLQSSVEKDRWWHYELNNPFIKMLPNDVTASIAIAQFKKLKEMQARRKHIWGIYHSELKYLDWIELPPNIGYGQQHSYFTYAIKILNGKRDKLARYLLDNGIYTTVRYEPLHLYKQFGFDKKLPVSEKLGEQLLNIPLHPNLSDKDLDYIITMIKKFK